MLIRQDNVNRVYWPIACITKVHPGQDGIVQSVDLLLSNGSTAKRSTHKLHHLETFEVDSLLDDSEISEHEDSLHESLISPNILHADLLDSLDNDMETQEHLNLEQTNLDRAPNSPNDAEVPLSAQRVPVVAGELAGSSEVPNNGASGYNARFVDPQGTQVRTRSGRAVRPRVRLIEYK